MLGPEARVSRDADGRTLIGGLDDLLMDAAGGTRLGPATPDAVDARLIIAMVCDALASGLALPLTLGQ
jgi:hypothetical protein